ncbi:MAG: hypothetical protein AABX01_02860, partial [Candidatus Micrarchaeota archaeon]
AGAGAIIAGKAADFGSTGIALHEFSTALSGIRKSPHFQDLPQGVREKLLPVPEAGELNPRFDRSISKVKDFKWTSRQILSETAQSIKAAGAISLAAGAIQLVNRRLMKDEGKRKPIGRRTFLAVSGAIALGHFIAAISNLWASERVMELPVKVESELKELRGLVEGSQGNTGTK